MLHGMLTIIPPPRLFQRILVLECDPHAINRKGVLFVPVAVVMPRDMPLEGSNVGDVFHPFGKGDKREIVTLISFPWSAEASYTFTKNALQSSVYRGPGSVPGPLQTPKLADTGNSKWMIPL